MDELELVAETEGMLWSVRTNGTVFLINRNRMADWSNFDVHVVSDGGVEYLGETTSPEGAKGLIRDHVNG